MTKSIYVAGPMTGLPRHNFSAFDEAAERLRLAGWSVYGPVEIGWLCGVVTSDENEPDAETYRRLVRAEMAALVQCDAIYLLKGWESSKGTRLELEVALALGLDVIQEGAETNGK